MTLIKNVPISSGFFTFAGIEIYTKKVYIYLVH